MSKSKNNFSEKQVERFNQSKLFQLTAVQGKNIGTAYCGKDISSDGGALLLREVENQIGIISSLGNCITDKRDSRYVSHEVHHLFSQRVMQIACGYEDANDCDALNSDAVMKICSGRLPYSDPDLASQPTMSRFENSVSRTDLYRMSQVFLDQFINSYADEPSVIILDCDDTNNNAYGDQQLILFNNYYGEYCFMPLHIYEGLTGKLIATILKPGRRSKNANVFAILSRIIKYLRQCWPNTKIIVRGDSHFASHQLMDWADDQYEVHFITGMSGNAQLKQLACVTIESAEREYNQYQKPVKRYHSFSYKAQSWKTIQRIVVKVEVNSMGTNIRYIVTDLWEYRATHLYKKAYCARGSAELRIKDHKLYLKSDRSSCNSFQANQFRLFLHSAAYILIHTLQKEMFRGTAFANATMKTIQLKILKVAAWVKELKTKIKIEMPQSYPYKNIQSNCLEMFQMIRC